MDVLTDPDAMRRWSASRPSVALVPTMGALHDGHLALVDTARGFAEAVVVSIFVNPMQFDRPDDFEAYPRPLDRDLDECRRLGVDAVYAPTAPAMYPTGFDTRVEPGDLADRFEGEHRPGHFGGVATVVTKLLAATRPDVAVFGRKDAQQLAVVRRLVADLDLGVRIVGVPTVREPDGVARSSRNALLDPTARAAAAAIPRALDAGRVVARRGSRSAANVVDAVRAVLADEPALEPEYVALVDARTFTPLVELGVDPDAEPLVVLAAWVGGVRLIDNVDPFGDDPL